MSSESTQSGETTNRSMPPGTIIPELVYNDMPAAVQWLVSTFGFRERLRIGNHRTQVLVDATSSIVVIQGEQSYQLKDFSLMVRVADVDQHYERAKQHGAHIISPPADYPYGERQYTVEDFAGRRWTFSQSVADIDPKEWGGQVIS